MSIHAGFFKRLFSFVIDLTLMILVTWLLYLFPFQQIIGKGIDSDYKNNIQKPYNEISEKYSGTVSYFGSSTEGYFTILSNSNNKGYLGKDDLQKYLNKQTTAYNTVKSVINEVETSMAEKYDSSLSEDEQFHSKMYEVYEYFYYVYQIKSNFPVNEEYVSYEALKEKGEINDDQLKTLQEAYRKKASEEYTEQAKLILSAIKNYEALNEGLKAEDLLSYQTIYSAFVGNDGKKEDITSEFKTEDKTALLNYLEAFRNYQTAVTSETKLGYQTVDGVSMVTLSKEAFYNFYYALQFEQFDAQLPYYVKIYKHTNWAIIYSLSMFTLAFSIYTVAMRGQTLGRRCLKIKLTDGHEKEKVNPLLALLHDVPFKFLYILLLGMFSLMIAGIVALVFTIADGIMIWRTREHKCIRDIITKTRVVDSHSY